MIGSEMLLQMVDQIAVQFHPKRVILFGSRAAGTSADLKAGVAVSVTGTIAKTVIHASSIKA